MKLQKKFTNTLKFRLDEASLAKVDQICEACILDRSDVMRYLIKFITLETFKFKMKGK